jgi:ABC-type polysaccharide/polyol phosphate transport system ATPase subunit
MQELIFDSNRTVVIVSHDMKAMANLCSKILWINDGEFVRYGDAREVLAAYEAFMST